MKNNLSKLTVALIARDLLEYSCSDMTADDLEARISDLMSGFSADESFNKYIAETIKSVAMISETVDEDLSEPDEHDELVKLNESINVEVAELNEADIHEHKYFTIIIGGRIHRFLVGGPQIAALSTFIDHICDENFYSDIK